MAAAIARTTASVWTTLETLSNNSWLVENFSNSPNSVRRKIGLTCTTLDLKSTSLTILGGTRLTNHSISVLSLNTSTLTPQESYGLATRMNGAGAMTKPSINTVTTTEIASSLTKQSLSISKKVVKPGLKALMNMNLISTTKTGDQNSI